MATKIKFVFRVTYTSKDEYIKATSMGEALQILAKNGIKPIKIQATRFKTTTFIPMGQFNFELSLL